MSEFVAYAIVGIVTGSIYAVAASGLVVTYVTSGIFNIAHGAIGMLMAFTYWELRVHQGWPAPIALFVVIFVLAPLMGAVIERFLIRPLRGAPFSTQLVVTVGLMVFFIGLAQALWRQDEARTLRKFFAPHGFQVGGVVVDWHDAITVLTGAAVAVGLWFILTKTRMGVAMRAVVDDRNLAALTGARPDRVSQLSWAIGASLASIAGILLAPVLQLQVTVLTLLVINAYAAAMVGRLRSLPLTFIGAMVLGLVEALTVGFVKLQGVLQGLRPSLPTVFLFVILLTMPEARLRAGRLLRSEMPAIPGRRQSLVGAGALVVAAFAISLVLDESGLFRIEQALALGLIMLSLVLLTGLAGQVSLCQMTFAGIGAFAAAKWGAGGSPLGLILAIVLAAAVGAIVALPALRLQGLYLALATMAFAVLMDNMFFPDPAAFGSFGSLRVDRLRFLGISFDGERAFFILLATAFAATGVLVNAIRRGSFGRVLTAMRDSPVACATLGLSLTRTKLAVFGISAGIAGIGGAMYGAARTQAGASDFMMLQSLPLLLLAVVGGITTVSGALLGGLAFMLMPLVTDFLAERVIALDGLPFLLAGLAAIFLGKNPNGIAQALSRENLPFVRRRRAPPQPASAGVPDAVEVSRVAASAG